MAKSPEPGGKFPITIYHNPDCGTSRDALAKIRAAGHRPTVVEYLKVGWMRPQLEALFKSMGVRPGDVLRTKGALAGNLGLLEPGVADGQILDAMIEHPVLVERPIVVTPLGAKLTRPASKVLELLNAAP